MADELYDHATPLIAGVMQPAPGDGFIVACAAPGFVRMLLVDGKTMDIYAVVGTAEFRRYAAVGYTIPSGSSADVRVTLLG